MAAGWHRSAIEFTDRRATRSRWRTASAGSVFGTCCCAGKLRSPARVPKNRLSSRRSLRCQPPRHPLRPHLRPSLRAPPAYPCRPERGITAGRTPSWASRPQKPRASGSPWGRGASALDPSVTRPAVWKPPAAAFDRSAGRVPHGALAISAHLQRAAAYGSDPITTMPRSGTDRSSPADTDGTSPPATHRSSL